MKTNMKLALSTITVPFGISFLSGVFLWELPEGMYILFGIAMIVGIIHAWIVETNRN